MNAFGLAPLLLVMPIIGMLFNIFVGRRLVDADRQRGEPIVGWFATAMTLTNFVIAILLFLSLSANHHEAQSVTLFTWFNIPSAGFYIPWEMYIDTLSTVMMLVITGVGSLIHIYAIGYMHGDKDFAKFFVYLNMFIFFMLILVTGSSYLMLFVGWEGVGLCSFLLIGFWFDRPDGVGLANNRAARKAFIANRVGDFAMILAMILLFWVFGSMQYEVVFEHAIDMRGEMVTLFGTAFPIGQVLSWITALFLMGAAGKSAQIPLYIWLPDAMAGPTPVSALIHAATMVTSGIYLITRSNVLFELVRESHHLLFGLITTNDLVALTGAATALFAGLIAFTQFDVKKVLAYSTVSQLGFMIAAVGMGAYVAGMFHLVTHAFFKALLFMGSGSIIHGMEHGHHHMHEHGHGHDDHHGDDHHGDDHHDDHHDEFDPQDMRLMGGLRKQMPWTFWTYMAGTLALAGIFPFAGFWSKDEILAHANYNGADNGVFIVVGWLLTAAAFCTAFYMGRQIKMVFFGKPRSEVVQHVPESAPTMIFPLVVLAFASLLGGFLNTPYFSQDAAIEAGMADFALHSESEEVEHSEGEAAETEGEHAAAEGEHAEEAHDTGYFLAYEHWLEYSIESFHLTEEGVVHMPHTPTWLVFSVAGLSTALGVIALIVSIFVVYGRRPENAEDRDPLQSTPIWWMSVLPLDTLFVKGFVERVFNPFSDWLAEKFDWAFWHDFFHDRIIRDTFVAAAEFLRDVLDPKGVDGVVNGAASTARRLADVLRLTQTGNVGNYALSLFLGVVAVVAYFVFF